MPEVELKSIEPQTVMSLSFTGPYEQTGDRLDELMAWLLRAGHPYSAPPFCIYYDDPEQVPEDELRAEVCLPIEEQCDGDHTVTRKTVPGGEFACLVHTGPYEGIREVYRHLFDWMQQNGYRHLVELGTREVFHKILGQVDSVEELVTEVQVPVQKVEQPSPDA